MSGLWDGIAARIFGAPQRPDRVDPIFQQLWQQLEQVLDRERRWMDERRQLCPGTLVWWVHPHDFEGVLRFHLPAVHEGIQAQLPLILRRLRYPEGASVTIHVRLPASPDEVGVAPGRTVVEAFHTAPDAPPPFPVSEPAMAEVTVGAPVGIAPAPEAPPLAEVSETPLLWVRWEDGEGPREQPVLRSSVLGRAAPGTPVDVPLVADGLDEGHPLRSVARRAIQLDLEPYTLRPRVRNLSRAVGLRWLPHGGGSEALAPQAALALEGPGRLLWPSPDGVVPGFTTELEPAWDGHAELEAAGRCQRVLLRAPFTRVRADPRVLGDRDLRFAVDLSADPERPRLLDQGSLRLCLAGQAGQGNLVVRWGVAELSAGDVRVTLVLREG